MKTVIIAPNLVDAFYQVRYILTNYYDKKLSCQIRNSIDAIEFVLEILLQFFFTEFISLRTVVCVFLYNIMSNAIINSLGIFLISK